LAIDCRRPRTSLRSIGGVTIATIAAAPTRRSIITKVEIGAAGDLTIVRSAPPRARV
jgi:hypothetical protein